jgi:hypothetical protein
MKTIELKPVKLDGKYRERWNVHMSDFVHLYVDGRKVNNNIYRVGGFGATLKDKYFMLLKYTEDYCSDDITKDEDRKAHLKGCWCIIDNNGVEKVNFNQFDNVYLSGGQLYSLDNKYYNIETKEFYCDARSVMKTDNFIFLENAYDKDESKRGVLKIDKTSGEFELIR